MSAIANANARARARRAIAGAPFDGGALAMLQDIVDNLVVPELDAIDPFSEPSAVIQIASALSAIETPSTDVSSVALPSSTLPSLVSAVLASVEPAARYAEAPFDMIVTNCMQSCKCLAAGRRRSLVRCHYGFECTITSLCKRSDTCYWRSVKLRVCCILG